MNLIERVAAGYGGLREAEVIESFVIVVKAMVFDALPAYYGAEDLFIEVESWIETILGDMGELPRETNDQESPMYHNE